MTVKLEVFWNLNSAEIIKKLETSTAGLTSSEAQRRLSFYGPNILKPKKNLVYFQYLFLSLKVLLY